MPSFRLPVAALAFVFTHLLALGTGTDNVKERIAYKGLPLGVNCASVEVASKEQPSDNQTVQCAIMDGESIVYNESILWKNRADEGSMDTEQRFHNKIFSIVLTWENRSEFIKVRINVKDPLKFNCSVETDPMDFRSEVGESETISCYVRGLDTDMSRKQYDDFNTIWYHGCDEITADNPEYSRRNGTYRKKIVSYYKTSFDSLHVRKSTPNDTPGMYHCVLEYKGTRMFGTSSKLCVTTEKATFEELEIRTDYTEYYPQPGQNHTIRCSGNVFQGANIIWGKFNESSYEFDDICYDDQELEGIMCILDRPQVFCKKPTPGEPARRINNSFSGQLILWNVSISDNGLYQCLVQNDGQWQEVNFTVTVRAQVQSRSELTVILSVVAGVMFVAFLSTLLLYHFKKVEFHYLFKKKFAKPIRSDKPVTFLIYSQDVFRDNTKINALQDVTAWMDSKRLFYHNPNDGKALNNAGAAIAVHNEEVIQNCLSVTVILTPQLLKDNAMELFNTNETFNENVKRDLPIVFICTQEMKKKIYQGAKVQNDKKDSEKKIAGRNINVTIRRFMKVGGCLL